jgi:hypothetical protein
MKRLHVHVSVDDIAQSIRIARSASKGGACCAPAKETVT